MCLRHGHLARRRPLLQLMLPCAFGVRVGQRRRRRRPRFCRCGHCDASGVIVLDGGGKVDKRVCVSLVSRLCQQAFTAGCVACSSVHSSAHRCSVAASIRECALTCCDSRCYSGTRASADTVTRVDGCRDRCQVTAAPGKAQDCSDSKTHLSRISNTRDWPSPAHQALLR
jgi:hypothetical protein